MAIVHYTETNLDLRALTVHGLSAKTKDNAIGKFGTGLKYALAVLAREKHSVIIISEGSKYKLHCRAGEFRGKGYDQLSLRETYAVNGKFRTRNHLLPLTVEFGQNWDIQMAYREIESNTRDESGRTELIYKLSDDLSKMIEESRDGKATFIIIEGDEYQQQHHRRDEVFLNTEWATIALKDSSVEFWAFDEENDHSEVCYYRGINAGKIEGERTSVFTYNILADCHLSEERRIGQWMMGWYIRHAIANCEDASVIERFLTAPDGTYEAEMMFEKDMKLGAKFLEVASRVKVRRHLRETIEYNTPKSIEQLNIDLYPTPWRLVDNGIKASNGNDVAIKPSSVPSIDFKAIWEDRIAAVNAHAPSIAWDDNGEAPAQPVISTEVA